jgi:large subunit ribosomal protein L18
MASTSKKLLARIRRKARVRKKISGTTERPRLTVYRSAKHIYAQVVDDVQGVTIASASSLDKDFGDTSELDKKGAARRVGELVAGRCKQHGVEAVVFDRNGYLYTSGRVHALAEGAREGGLKF